MTETRNPVDAIKAYAEAKRAAARPEPVPEAPARHNGYSNGRTGYAGAALRSELAAVALAPVGERNDQLNTSSFNLGQLVGAGYLDRSTVAAALLDAGRAAGLTDREMLGANGNGGTINSGLNDGIAKPRVVVDLPLPPELSTFDGGEAAGAFWAARFELTHIEAFARARRACPWAVLGVVLARVIVAIPPWVVLPPLIGDEASLNMFIALVSGSGGGKGASEAAGAAAVDVGRITAAGVGSGEGLAHLFMRREKDGATQFREAVLMKATEIDTLAALGDRRGATLLPELRKAWSGEGLGFAYADPAKALPLHGHTYRLCLLAGVQPGRAQWVLDDADGGTPQRFLWLPAADRAAPDVAPACPERWTWKAPSWPMADAFTGHVVMPVAEVARQVIDKARLDRLREQGEPLDGHALLARLKAAAALAILAGQPTVSGEDWDLAGEISRVSDATRAGVVEHLRAEAKVRNIGRADAEADRAIAVTGRQEADALQRACAYVLRKLRAETDGMTGGELSRGTGGTVRGALDEALDALVETGQIVATEVIGGGTSGLRWKVKK